MWGFVSESRRKRTRRDLTPASSVNNVDNAMMDLLLDMSSQMQTMEEYVSQHSQHTLMGNQDSIPERSSVHNCLDDAAVPSGARAVAWTAAAPSPQGLLMH